MLINQLTNLRQITITINTCEHRYCRRGMEYHAPVRGIQNSSDLEHFKKSQLFTEISDFVKKCADSVVGKKISDPHYTSSSILKILAFLDRLFMIIAEIPPLKQPMRFGNKAFKTFHSRLCEESTIFLTDLFPIGMKDASFEVASYINTAFGNETRIDYGTGHELSFVLFLLCLYKLKVVDEKDFPAMILKCFTGYLKVMRRLHEEYLLEPAGSHGVWGLDDYHCLVFVWGAAQLVGHTEITPISIHNSGILSSNADEYIYLTGIQFIKVRIIIIIIITVTKLFSLLLISWT